MNKTTLFQKFLESCWSLDRSLPGFWSFLELASYFPFQRISGTQAFSLNSCIYKPMSTSCCYRTLQCAMLISSFLYYVTLDSTTVTWCQHLLESLLTHESRLISPACTHSSNFWTVNKFSSDLLSLKLYSLVHLYYLASSGIFFSLFVLLNTTKSH